MSVTAVPLRPLGKGTIAKLWIGIVLVLLLGAALAWLGTSALQVTTTQSGLRYRVIEEGTGPTATAADLIGLEYEVRTEDGKVVDRSQPGQPAPFATQGVVPGFAEALLLMREGGIYQLWLTPQLAYGSASPPQSGIAANETLEFRVRVVGILEGMASMQPQLMQQQQMQQQQMMGDPQGPGIGPEQMGPPPGPGAGPEQMPPPPPAGPGGR